MRCHLVAMLVGFCAAMNGGCRNPVHVEAEHGCDAVRRSIRIGKERAHVHNDQRVAPWTSIAFHDAPFDLALEIVWLEVQNETFGVIWARQGEDSHFQPVRMFLPPKYPRHTPHSLAAWPQREVRTVDVLLRPSELALLRSEVKKSWQGTILIEDVPVEWIEH